MGTPEPAQEHEQERQLEQAPILDEEGKFTDFERDYFKQTRSEIDSDKRERDVFLNFAILIVGGSAALAFGQATLLPATESGSEPILARINDFAMFGFTIPGLFILTALMWMRRQKLVQIGIRWSVLHTLLSSRANPKWVPKSLETQMLDRFRPPAKAVRKEVVLTLAVSSPIYAVLVAQIWVSLEGLGYSPGMLFPAAVVLLVHIVGVWFGFTRPLREVHLPELSPEERSRQ